MQLAPYPDAIPLVLSDAQRAAKFPSPDTNQRVFNLETKALERWTGSTWARETLIQPFWDVGGAVHNVKAYGAVGDGVADDTAAIQAAIDAAAASAAAAQFVYLPSSAYRLDNGLVVGTDRVHLVGGGRRRTIINYFGTGDAITASGSGSIRTLHIKDLSIRGVSGIPTGHGIALSSLNVWSIVRVEVRGFVATGKAAIHLTDCLDGSVRDCNLGSSDADGEVANGIIAIGESDYNLFSSVIVSAIREKGFWLNEDAGAVVPDANTFLNCKAYDGASQVGTVGDATGFLIQGATNTVMLNPWCESLLVGIQTATFSGGSPNRLLIVGGQFTANTLDIDLPTGTAPTLIGVRAPNGIEIGSGCTLPLLLNCQTPTVFASATGSMVRASDQGISANRGDNDVTLVSGTDVYVQRFATALTANRVVTLSSTNAVRSSRFRIVRTGLGAFTLDVGGLKTIPSATAAFVDVMHDGTAWRLIGYGEL